MVQGNKARLYRVLCRIVWGFDQLDSIHINLMSKSNKDIGLFVILHIPFDKNTSF